MIFLQELLSFARNKIKIDQKINNIQPIERQGKIVSPKMISLREKIWQHLFCPSWHPITGEPAKSENSIMSDVLCHEFLILV